METVDLDSEKGEHGDFVNPNWSNIITENSGKYTVLVAGKPMQIIVKPKDTPVGTSSHVGESQNFDKDASLYSNNDLKTDDSRETERSKAQIEINNLTMADNISYSDTETNDDDKNMTNQTDGNNDMSTTIAYESNADDKNSSKKV